MSYAMKVLTVTGVLALMALGLALSSENVAARSATSGYSCPNGACACSGPSGRCYRSCKGDVCHCYCKQGSPSVPSPLSDIMHPAL
jgi:hypothetical protein